MGQKIHPLGLRLNITQRHRSRWCAKTRHYPRLVLEDNSIRQYLLKKYPKAGISEIFINRDPKLYHRHRKCLLDPIRIRIYAEKPYKIASGTWLDRRKMLKSLCSELESLHLSRIYAEKPFHLAPATELKDRKRLERLRSKLEPLYNSPNIPAFSKPLMYVALRPVEVLETQASSIALNMIARLKKREPFRPLLRTALRKAKEKRIPGIKIQISGRLNGAEIARTEWVRHGRIPLHTLRANLDYCYKTVNTLYGILGIKIWTLKSRQIWNYAKYDPEDRHIFRLRLRRLVWIKYYEKRKDRLGLVDRLKRHQGP